MAIKVNIRPGEKMVDDFCLDYKTFFPIFVGFEYADIPIMQNFCGKFRILLGFQIELSQLENWCLTLRFVTF